jgi:hypothetical protein
MANSKRRIACGTASASAASLAAMGGVDQGDRQPTVEFSNADAVSARLIERAATHPGALGKSFLRLPPDQRSGLTAAHAVRYRPAEERADDADVFPTVGLPDGGSRPPEKDSVQMYGNVDGLDNERRLAGWAWTAAAQPDEPVSIHVYERDVLMAQGLADHYRPDVKAAGYGDGKAGFLLPLPEPVFDGATHRFEVRMLFAGGSLTRMHDVFLPSSRLPDAPQPARETGSERQGGLFVPGHVVTYTAGMVMPPYHAQGWGLIDEAGAWMQGTDATLEFVIRRPADAYILEIDVVPGPFKGGPPGLELYFNYMRIGFASVPVSRLITCRLPNELFALRRSILGFHCRQALESVNGAMGVLALRRWTIY